MSVNKKLQLWINCAIRLQPRVADDECIHLWNIHAYLPLHNTNYIVNNDLQHQKIAKNYQPIFKLKYAVIKYETWKYC